MKQILIIFALIAAVAANVDPLWEQYKAEHGKEYENVLEDYERSKLFHVQRKIIDEFNAQSDKSYEMGLNHFSDWTETELNSVMGVLKVDEARDLFNSEGRDFLDKLLEGVSDKEVPDSVDWRKVEGRVTEVKDQKQCGSCWAFATAGMLEGQELMRSKSRKLQSLSVQQMVDCSSGFNLGCYGGLVSYALQDIIDMGGLEPENDYSYTGRMGRCHFNQSKSVISVKGHTLLRPDGDEQQLKEVVASYGPVAVAIGVTQKFFGYKSGVFSDPDCAKLRPPVNHAVLIVGYGTDPKHGDYWLVKNSWGTSWGTEGYGLLARNMQNQCAVASLAVIATF